jgi:hypothetical protein
VPLRRGDTPKLGRGHVGIELPVNPAHMPSPSVKATSSGITRLRKVFGRWLENRSKTPVGIT